MHYGLKLAQANVEVAAAFDIDDVANDVYERNFGIRPHQVGGDASSASPCGGNPAADAYVLYPVQYSGSSAVAAGKAGRRYLDDGAPMPALYSQVGRSFAE